MKVIIDAARFCLALSWAARTATGSISPAATRVRSNRAAAIASTPVPVPISSTLRVRRRFVRSIQREEAAAGRAVMTGAEGERCFDLDADLVGSRIGAVMRAVNDETARAHRLESGKASGNPVVGGDPLDAERVRCRLPGCKLDQVAQRGLVRSSAEMNCHLPALRRRLRTRHRPSPRHRGFRRDRRQDAGRSIRRRPSGRRWWAHSCGARLPFAFVRAMAM